MDVSTTNIAVIGGSKTNYRIDGPENAEHLFLLIHGIGSFHTCFDGITEALIAANRRVVRYDLLGRGRSDYWSNNHFGADEHVSQLLGLIEHLGVTKPIHLIGHSMGGALAALFAAAHPTRVASLALLCPAGLMDGTVLGCVRSLRCLHGAIKIHCVVIKKLHGAVISSAMRATPSRRRSEW